MAGLQLSIVTMASFAFLSARSHRQALAGVGCGTDYSRPSAPLEIKDMTQMWFVHYVFTCDTRGSALWVKFRPNPYVQMSIALPEIPRFDSRRGEILVLGKGLAGAKSDLDSDATIPPSILKQAQMQLAGNSDWGWERVSSPDDQKTCSHVTPQIKAEVANVESASFNEASGRCRIIEGDAKTGFRWWIVVDKHLISGETMIAAFWLREVGSTAPADGKMEVWVGPNIDLTRSESEKQRVECPLYPTSNLGEIFKQFYESDGRERDPIAACSKPASAKDQASLGMPTKERADVSKALSLSYAVMFSVLVFLRA